jgi:hypothetical protein
VVVDPVDEVAAANVAQEQVQRHGRLGEAAIAHGQCGNNAARQSQRDGATARRFSVAAAVKGPIGRKFGTGVRTPEALLNVSPLNAAMAVEVVAGNSVGDPLMADDLH